MSDSAPFRVLALDGGGIRGVLPAVLLGELEARTGRPTAEVFDLIVGTSTGGILALALAAPRTGAPFSPADLLKLYETQGARIFAPWPRSEAGKVVEDLLERALHLDADPTPGRPLPWTRAVLHPKFTAEGIEGTLQEVLGQAMLADVSSTRVAVTAYDLDARSLRLFRSWEAATTPSSNLPLWQAARATSAAPVFFPPAVVTCQDGTTLHCVDGGVCVNDPAVVAVAEARRLLGEIGQAERSLVVVSVGTGAPPASSLPFAAVQNAGLLEWARHGLLDVIMGSGAFAANFELGELLGADQHFRLQPATSGPGYAADPAMDDVSAANVGQLVAAARAFVDAQGPLFDRLAQVLPARA